MKKILFFLFALLCASTAFATVNVTTTRMQYNCNGTSTNYAYSFKVYANDELQVVKKTSAGVESTLVLNTNYTVTGAGTSGGNVVLTTGATCASGETLTIIRDMDLVQETDYADGGGLSAETIEADFDKARMIDQQLQEQINRSIKLDVSTEIGELNLPPPGAGDLIGWNTLGTDLTTYSQTRTIQTLDAVTVENINELRLTTGVAGAAVQPIGYYSSGDGAGGPIRTWATGAPGTYTDNGGSIIVPTGGDGSGAWLGSDLWNWTAKEFGAKGDGINDDTSKINTYISYIVSLGGGEVYFPNSTYMTMGGHTIPYSEKITVRGETRDGAILKKISGTAVILTTEQYSENTVKDLTFDGNMLGGSAIIWRSHYSLLSNIFFKNVRGTSYALHISGSNVCNFDRLYTNDVCYGGILIDQSSDPLPVKPTYGLLYSNFNSGLIAIGTGGSTDPYGACIMTRGALVGKVTFNDYDLEYMGAYTSKGALLDISGSNHGDITFNNLSIESTPVVGQLIEVNNAAQLMYNIAFYGGRISKSADTYSTGLTPNVFLLNGISGVEIEGMSFNDFYSATPAAVIKFLNIKNGSFKNNICSFLNNFNFLDDFSGNSYITEEGNSTRYYSSAPGVGTNSWSTATNITLDTNSEFTQSISVVRKGMASFGTAGELLNTTTSGSYTGTLTGCTTSPTSSVKYEKVGNIIALQLVSDFSATSNATTKTITGSVPASILPTAARRVMINASDSGGAYVPALATIGTNGTITIYKDLTGNNWTASGTAGILGFNISYIQ